MNDGTKNIKVKEELHYKLKLQAFKERISLMELMNKMFLHYIKTYKKVKK